jgi:HEXXH motif-containing protein
MLVPSARRALGVLQASADYPSGLEHPACRYLLAAIRRFWPQEPDLALDFLTKGLADLAWPRQLRESLGTATWTSHTDTDGGLRTIGLGCWLELGPSYADTPVRITVENRRALIIAESDGLTIEVLPEDLTGTASEEPTITEHGFAVHRSLRTTQGVEVDARDPWLRPVISGTNQRTDGIGFYGSTWEPYRQKPHLAAIHAGLQEIGDNWPEALEELTLFTRTIVPLKADHSAYRAFTVLSRQGAVFLGDAPAPHLAEMLLHETAHIKLRQMQLLDPLLTDPLDESFKVSVPWRPDPRPLPGVLEGVFVFCHVAEFQVRRFVRGVDDLLVPTQDRLRHLRRAYQVICDHAHLTEGGLAVLAAVGEWIDDLERRANLH